ncbi:MAG: hypothetical protein HOD97_02070 [Candidatus Marinimicrobia bacterium]|nr:hypothetical protein [Candidatus Neomarinimicrobiota bacterium]MBT3617804.1 hypothetical protein [Candidatus Neomarinimicrobiota bacterium]MBT3829604.1 hypothetical protein [Candidatus Neomarinimicrobiota bacterium]MBT3996733.1 hypothetical protein [Candidatus Neomarinimicrobiota bacterium]MBT4280397.1 hypothetical protein [Candidatus Neomarinimicrobiota bacterium]
MFHSILPNFLVFRGIITHNCS